MIWFALAAVYVRILFFNRFDVSFWIPLTFHRACTNWAEIHLLHPVFSGLVCGEDLPLSLKTVFLPLGVYHWFVASGGHLVFLQLLLQKLPLKNSIFTFCLLMAFSLTCGLQPPIARALISLIIGKLSGRWSLFLKPHQITWLAGLWSLALFPQWYTSFSFQLSWLVALALPWSSKHSLQSLWVSLLLVPISLHWSPLHLLYNIVLTPVFSLILFPLTLLGFALAPLTLIGNHLWELVIVFCKWLPSDHNPLSLPSPLVLWIYILALQCAHTLRRSNTHV